VVARHHALARSRGIAWPEVQWPGVVIETLPVLASLAAAELDDFVLREIQLRRSLRLADGAAGCLGWLRDREMLLGIASNAQAYTLRELDEALAGAGLDQSLFDPGLRFWSFLHGFSKPDPHVFRILAARLEARGIGGGETLMVGDHLNNDIGPALAHGWQAWHLAPHVSSAVRGGTWRELAGFLGG
jgi:FMN phosphatase YigB (HAD superfamily)